MDCSVSNSDSDCNGSCCYHCHLNCESAYGDDDDDDSCSNGGGDVATVATTTVTTNDAGSSWHGSSDSTATAWQDPFVYDNDREHGLPWRSAGAAVTASVCSVSSVTRAANTAAAPVVPTDGIAYCGTTSSSSSSSGCNSSSNSDKAAGSKVAHVRVLESRGMGSRPVERGRVGAALRVVWRRVLGVVRGRAE